MKKIVVVMLFLLCINFINAGEDVSVSVEVVNDVGVNQEDVVENKQNPITGRALLDFDNNLNYVYVVVLLLLIGFIVWKLKKK